MDANKLIAGFFVLSCRQHINKQKQIVKAVLLDNLCAASSGIAAAHVWNNASELISIKKQTANGDSWGPALDLATKKWVSLYDYEVNTNTVEYHVRSFGSNIISLEINNDVVLTSQFVWLNPTKFRAPRKMKAVVHFKVKNISELADYIAHDTFVEARYPFRFETNPHFQGCRRIAPSLPLSNGTFLPVQWDDAGIGVLEIKAIDEFKTECLLWACNGEEGLRKGAVLKRQSGWTISEDIVPVSSEVGTIIELDMPAVYKD